MISIEKDHHKQVSTEENTNISNLHSLIFYFKQSFFLFSLKMIHIVQNQLGETTNFLNSLKLAISVDFKSIGSFNKSLHNCGLAMTKG